MQLENSRRHLLARGLVCFSELLLAVCCCLVVRLKRLPGASGLAVLLTTLLAAYWYCHFSSDSRLPTVRQGRPGLTGSNSTTLRYVNPAVIEVISDANFTDRLADFNVQLGILRSQLRDHRSHERGGNSTSSICDADHLGTGRQRVISGTRENYIDQLSNSSDVVTVVLPWLGPRRNWTSLADFSNVPYQRYHEWTADNVLCSWIETPRFIKARYDSVYRRTCVRRINSTASPRSLLPVHLNARPINRQHYWPNDGDSFPAHFYTDTPPHVFHVHVHRNAVVTRLGDVITADTKLVLYGCSYDVAPTLLLRLRGKLSRVPCYDELYVIAQCWGNGIFHRMAEIVPRLVPGLRFLADHPQIRIAAPQVGGRLAELLAVIGVDRGRLVAGVARANVVYQPRSTPCGFANVQESQTLSRLYRDYIRRTFPARPRNRLILIRRSRSRRFSEQTAVEEVVRRAASDHNLTYALFADNPTPSLNNTMMLFHSAVLVVAPVGAGESNLFFSQPGTYVVEGVCNVPHVNLCFQRLAHILGHHWHGVTSRGGCEAVVDVPAARVDAAVRSHLRLWMLERSSAAHD